MKFDFRISALLVLVTCHSPLFAAGYRLGNGENEQCIAGFSEQLVPSPAIIQGARVTVLAQIETDPFSSPRLRFRTCRKITITSWWTWASTPGRYCVPANFTAPGTDALPACFR